MSISPFVPKESTVRQSGGLFSAADQDTYEDMQTEVR